MNELLSEQELDETLSVAIGSLYIQHGRDGVNTGMIVDTIKPIIQSQKIAHADMVIGEDEPHRRTNVSDLVAYRRNQLRAKQRERNV